MLRALILTTLATLALTTTLPPAQAAQVDVPVYLHEYNGNLHMIPDVANANVGDTVRFTIINEGVDHDNSPHNFWVCGDGTDPGSECNDKWGFSGQIANNQTAVVTIVAKKAGTFDYYCAIPGHKQAGMSGILTVAGNGPATKTSGGGALVGTLIALAAVAGIRRKVTK